MGYRIGIDVGGSNTNGVLLHGSELLGTAQCPTEPEQLLASTAVIMAELRRLLPPQPSETVELHLSTTLTTNAIV